MTNPTAAATTVQTVTRCCPWCGGSFDAPTGVRGRPRVYCDDRCKDADARMNQLERLVDDTVHEMTPERAAEVRRRLWRMANLMNSVGVKARREAEAAARAEERAAAEPVEEEVEVPVTYRRRWYLRDTRTGEGLGKLFAVTPEEAIALVVSEDATRRGHVEALSI